MPAERRGGDACFDESDDDDEFEGFSTTDIEASATEFAIASCQPISSVKATMISM